MASSRIEIAGPPERAKQARVGFPWVLPLTSPPSAVWSTRFEEVDWRSLAPQLRPPYHPRLDGDRVWLPGLEPDALRPILDIVADQVEQISSAVVEEEQTAVSREAETDEARRRRDEASSAAFDEWWKERRAG
ncbi:MAG: hypothetical protein E6G34_06480 [Actinobacteria bacterium]|nr:MAG: hypothetical protein E6G34_06480 [Actinomycetota bacterium]